MPHHAHQFSTEMIADI